MAKILSLVVQNALKFNFFNLAPKNNFFLKSPPDLTSGGEGGYPLFHTNPHMWGPFHPIYYHLLNFFLLLTWRTFYFNPVTTPVIIIGFI